MKPLFDKLFCLLMLITLMTSTVYGAYPAENAITGQGAIVIDQTTGRALFEKNADEALFPASTTKVLTALIILEDLKLDDVVTIDSETPFTEGSRIYLIEGEKVTVEQLLGALLVTSANDAATALAKYHSGTVQAFARVMNSRAKALGATHSNFINPNGLHDPRHVTSARDLALIAAEAMKNPIFRKYVNTTSYTIPPTNKQPEARYLHNGNKLINPNGMQYTIPIDNQRVSIKWDLADGIKTGYTPEARQTLVASAYQNGRRVIAVSLKSEGKDVYRDVRVMMQYALERFTNIPVVKKGAAVGVLHVPEENADVPLYADKTIYATVPVDAIPQVPQPTLLPAENLVFPVSKDQFAADAAFAFPDGQSFTVHCYAAQEVKSMTLASRTARLAHTVGIIAHYVFIFLSLSFFAYVLWRIRVTMQRVKKRKRLQQLKNRAERK